MQMWDHLQYFAGKKNSGCADTWSGIGILFLAAGLISRGAIGAGDCWILLALGALLDTETYIRMLCIGFFLAAFWSGILLVIRRKSRKTEIPLVPFLLAGYIGGILI